MPSTPEPRYDCPVCTGLPMKKLKITRQHEEVFLTLDCCQRCGGVWFDEGEVQLSQRIQSEGSSTHWPETSTVDDSLPELQYLDGSQFRTLWSLWLAQSN